MKRGIVMDAKGKKAVILTEDGLFETVRLGKGKFPVIGEEVEVPVPSRRFGPGKNWFPSMAVAAVMFIFAVLLSGTFLSSPSRSAAAYISYDINPSFSAAVNGDLQVVSVKTWNADAAQMFGEWESYQFMKLEDFSDEVLRRFAANGYLKANPRFLIATSVIVSDERKREKIRTALKKTVNEIRSDTLLQQNDVVLVVKNADPQVRKDAYQHGLSLGKYLVYLEALNSGKNLSIPMIKQLSVSDIWAKIHTEQDTSVFGDSLTAMGDDSRETEGKDAENGYHRRKSTDTEQETAEKHPRGDKGRVADRGYEKQTAFNPAKKHKNKHKTDKKEKHKKEKHQEKHKKHKKPKKDFPAASENAAQQETSDDRQRQSDEPEADEKEDGTNQSESADGDGGDREKEELNNGDWLEKWVRDQIRDTLEDVFPLPGGLINPLRE